MNFKSILLSITLVFGLMPNTIIPMQKSAFLSRWLSKAKISEMAQQISNSKAFEWAKENKLALLGATAAITGGILAYNYFWKKPSNEEIKARIKKETLKILRPHAENVKKGIVAPFFWRNKRSIPPHSDDYEMKVESLVREGNIAYGIRATYLYQCDNSSDFFDILFK